MFCRGFLKFEKEKFCEMNIRKELLIFSTKETFSE